VATDCCLHIYKQQSQKLLFTFIRHIFHSFDIIFTLKSQYLLTSYIQKLKLIWNDGQLIYTSTAPDEQSSGMLQLWNRSQLCWGEPKASWERVAAAAPTSWARIDEGCPQGFRRQAECFLVFIGTWTTFRDEWWRLDSIAGGHRSKALTKQPGEASVGASSKTTSKRSSEARVGASLEAMSRRPSEG
jgi:hypothetical protein